jgi:hypothetical protein
MNEAVTNIPARLVNIAVGGYVAGADMIVDDNIGKSQETLNNELQALSVVMSSASADNAGATTVVSNPEWKCVLTDYEDKILCGIKVDGKFYMYATINEILDCIIDGWTS